MMSRHSVTRRYSMKLLGLASPRFTHRDAVRSVLASAATVFGFAFGAWVFEAPLDRESAVALFVGLLYVQAADPFLAMRGDRMKRYAVAGSGAGILVAMAAVLEPLV